MFYDTNETAKDMHPPSESPQPQAHRVGYCFEQLRGEILNMLENETFYADKIQKLEAELLNVYKRAYNDVDSERRQLDKLKQDAVKEKEDSENQIKGFRVVALVDGDGAIFSGDLIAQGKAGGHAAAQKLSDSIMQHLSSIYGANQYQLWVYVFLNKRGLVDTFGRVGNVMAKQKFKDFMIGFNQAAERFIMVDVGDAKEAADAKIKARLEDEIRLPQTYKIIFGGCHDNGYVTNLRSQMTAGFKQKLILLRSYTDMAAGIADLELPVLTIPDLFLTQKLVKPHPAQVALSGQTGHINSSGHEPLCSAREERTENGRKDRDERERARSRGRDSSSTRREPSASRRNREREQELDRDGDDDSCRGGDDGKRDERLAARRIERHSERLREKDSVLDPGVRSWVAAEDRETRGKCPTGRERKTGPLVDDGKDRHDWRDHERERQKELAWMDTCVPPPSSSGILSEKTGDGELDGIQAWKKERKEKEIKDKGAPPSTNGNGVEVPETGSINLKPEVNGKQLDEIQLFRLLMKREEGKKKSDDPDDNPQSNLANLAGKAGAVNARPSQRSSIPPSEGLTLGPPAQSGGSQPSTLSPPEAHSTPAMTTPNPLLSLGGKEPPSSLVSPETPLDAPKTSSTALNRVNPPPGSRLLAFLRAPTTASRPPTSTNSSMVSQNGTYPNLGLPQLELAQQISSKTEVLRSPPGFSPYEEQNRSSHGLADHSDTGTVAISPDVQRHTFTPSSEHPPFLDRSSSDNGSGYSANKGSRFAKFFDAKGRDGAPAVPKNHTSVGLVSSSPGPSGQQQDHGGFNGNLGNAPDLRAVDEIYAMLSSSAQGPRGEPVHIQSSAQNSGGFALQPQNNLHLLLQQLHQHHQQQLHTNRSEPLYESRLDVVPDGMVPGLRSAPPPRNRENPWTYSENLEDMPFNVQQRNLDQLYAGGPSPISHQQNHLQNPQQQRLPPGLANLGGRPPHGPSQFLGMPDIPSPGSHGALLPNGLNRQQSFNNFHPGGI